MSETKRIETNYRKIISEIPHPTSLAFIKKLSQIEPRSMSGFSPIVWDHAERFQVYDAHGNKWIDFSSSVILANAGHSNARIGKAIRDQLDVKLWQCYCNPSRIRFHTIKMLAEIIPSYLDKIFLLSTGSEAIECAIKLMRFHGRSISTDKIHIVSYYNSFHGRTMGSQTAGGIIDQQEWMGQRPGGFHHIPFPECARCPWGKVRYKNCGKECFQKSLKELRKKGVQDKLVAGVITETYQGPTVAFMPVDYVQALREWLDEHQALLVFDEIQAGFGRTGKWFGFEHYGVRADLICMSKGMTSSLPMSAVAGQGTILDLVDHGQMSSTHTGNPLCCAAVMANIKAIKEDQLLKNAAALGDVACQTLKDLRNKFPEYIGAINGKGLVWAIYLLDPATKQLNIDLAKRVTTRCMQYGLFMLQTNCGTLKIAPPLCISKEAFLEGISVIAEAIAIEKG